MKITILYLGKKGAGPVYSLEMVKSLAENCVSLQVLLSDQIENKNSFVEFFKEKNIVYSFIPTYKDNKIDYILKSLNFIKFIYIANKIKEFNPNYVYIPMISLWAAKIIKFLPKKVKIVTTIHDIVLHKGEQSKYVEKINSYIISRSCKLITLSKKFIKEIQVLYNKQESDICWIAHGNFNYYRPKDYIESKGITKTILFFGRIHEYKGISVLLDSMELVEDKEINLVIAGNGTLSRDDEVKIEKIGNRISLINRWIKDEEIYTFFQNVDLVVAPYIDASQSGVVMLAYSFGKPVIVTNTGGLPEQVFPDTGMIIPAKSSVELANAINHLYKNEELILQMGRNAFKKANSLFSWYNLGKQLIDFLK